MIKNYGLLEEIRELTAYVLGASKMPYIPYVDDGDWRPFKPPFEHQAPNFETSACTAFTVENQIQFFMKGVYGEDVDLSENFLALTVPIEVGKGVDPQKTYEAVRHSGMVDSGVLRMGRTKEEWSDIARLTKSIQAKGLYWLQKIDFFHEWLWDSPKNRPSNYMAILKDALKTSPIGISVSAWETEIDKWGNEVYVSRGDVNNHKTLCVFMDDEGYPWVYDSYQPVYKRLAKDHNIRRAKRIWLNKKTKPAMRRHISLLENILKALKLMKLSLLDVCTSALNTDVTPQDTTPDDVACAEVVTTLIKKIYPTFPIITGTYTLYEYLNNPKNGWRQVNEYEPETVVVAPTGMGLQGAIGHAWIVLEDGTLASNNSFGINRGKFTKNYTPATAEKKYTGEKKIPLYLFRKVV